MLLFRRRGPDSFYSPWKAGYVRKLVSVLTENHVSTATPGHRADWLFMLQYAKLNIFSVPLSNDNYYYPAI